jgi:hypothetical protein
MFQRRVQPCIRASNTKPCKGGILDFIHLPIVYKAMELKTETPPLPDLVNVRRRYYAETLPQLLGD